MTGIETRPLETWDRVPDRAGGVGPPRAVGGFVSPIQAAVRGASDRGRFYVIANPDVLQEFGAKTSDELAGDGNADR